MNKLEQQIKLIIKIYKSGALSEAESEAKNLIQINPKVAFLYNFLGIILLDQKKNEEALSYFEQGLKVDPNFAMIYNNLGLLFTNTESIRDIKKAENYYKKSIKLDKNIAEPHNNLGSLYTSLNNYEQAIKYFEKAIELNPNFSFAYFNLGSVFITTGELNNAKKYLRKSIELNPDNFIAHRTLSRIIKYTKEEKHFDQLNNLYNNIKSTNPDYKLNIGFALGKACEDLNDFDKSFFYYNESNALYRKKFKYSLNNEKKKFNEIKNIYNDKLFKKHKNLVNNTSDPIFIVGMPRSGTTLIEQIISSHDDVFGAGEVDIIPQLIKKNFNNNKFDSSNFKKIGDEYIEKIKSSSVNAKRTTDKLPINFLSIGFIKLILPNSKIIHCHRNPKDNIISIFKNHFPNQMIPFAYGLKEIVDYYNLYSNLMIYWNNVLPDFIFDIKYENLILNTKDEISKILKFCNLKWSDDCLNFHENKRPVKTASDSQVRNKIYAKSIDSWKNYEKFVKSYFANLKFKL
jgi:tetratricopeptide (TPR) repeat protein